VGGLLFTGITLRADAKAKRLQSLFTITQNHRQIWTEIHDRPELSRILAWAFLDEVRLIVVERKSMEAGLNRRDPKQHEELLNLRDGTVKLMQVLAELSMANAPHNPEAQKLFDERERVKAEQITKHESGMDGPDI